MNSYWSNTGIYVKLMREVSKNWKNWRSFRVPPSTPSQEEDQSNIKRLSWNSLARYRNSKNEIDCMNDSRDFQDAESVHSGHSHVTSQPVSFPPRPIPGGMLGRSIGMPSRREGPPSIWDLHGISGNVFLQIQPRLLQHLIRRKWIHGFQAHQNRFTHQRRRRMRIKHQFSIRDASPDRQPKIHSSQMREFLHRIMGQTNNDFRLRIFISTNSTHQQRLLVGSFDSRLRYVLVHNFLRNLCIGSKKRRWLIQWVIQCPRHLWEEFKCRILKYTMRGLLQHWTESSIILTSKRRISLEEQKAQKEDRFLRGRQIAYLIYEYFRVTGANDSVENYADLFTNGLRNDDIQEFDSKRNGIVFVYDENPTWWHPGRIVQTKNTRVWETQDRIGIVQPGDSSEENRTWLPQIDYDGRKKYRARFTKVEFWRQNWKLWEKHRGQESGDKTAWTEILETIGNGKPMDSVLKETIAVSVTMSINVQKWHCRIRLRILSCSRMKDEHREPEVPEEGVPVVECLDGHARITSEGTCTNSFCEKWHPPECLFYKTKSGSRFGEKFSYAHRQVDEEPCNRSKKKDD